MALWWKRSTFSLHDTRWIFTVSFLEDSALFSDSPGLVRIRAKSLKASSGESVRPCWSSKQEMIIPVRPFPPLQWMTITFEGSLVSHWSLWYMMVKICSEIKQFLKSYATNKDCDHQSNNVYVDHQIYLPPSLDSHFQNTDSIYWFSCVRAKYTQ